MTTALISALLQVGAVLLIAAGAWLAFRRPRPFRDFVGLLPARWTIVAAAFAGGAVLAFLITRLPAVQAMASAERTVVGETAQAGLTGEVAAILAIRALLQTSLSEELLFRGLIGRNLVRRFGFTAGNTAQAGLFGLVHLLLLLSPAATYGLVLALVLFTAVVGWVLGWMNESLADGSILPGWAAHGGGNLTAYLLLAAAV